MSKSKQLSQLNKIRRYLGLAKLVVGLALLVLKLILLGLEFFQ